MNKKIIIPVVIIIAIILVIIYFRREKETTKQEDNSNPKPVQNYWICVDDGSAFKEWLENRKKQQ